MHAAVHACPPNASDIFVVHQRTLLTASINAHRDSSSKQNDVKILRPAGMKFRNPDLRAQTNGSMSASDG